MPSAEPAASWQAGLPPAALGFLARRRRSHRTVGTTFPSSTCDARGVLQRRGEGSVSTARRPTGVSAGASGLSPPATVRAPLLPSSSLCPGLVGNRPPPLYFLPGAVFVCWFPAIEGPLWEGPGSGPACACRSGLRPWCTWRGPASRADLWPEPSVRRRRGLGRKGPREAEPRL